MVAQLPSDIDGVDLKGMGTVGGRTGNFFLDVNVRVADSCSDLLVRFGLIAVNFGFAWVDPHLLSLCFPVALSTKETVCPSRTTGTSQKGGLFLRILDRLNSWLCA